MSAVSPDVVDLPDLSPAEWLSWTEQQGWGDGLPTVPPTEDLVGAMLAALPPDVPDLGALPPSRLVPSVRTVAANAVMAGCRPVDLPVVLAALVGLTDERYNLHGTLATTHPCAPLVLVSGPARERLGLNSGTNCFGQGTRANAVVGRAVALTLLHVGGARPGEMDRSTQGSPAKYTYCAAENTQDSPWEPFAVRRGFGADESVVTVLAAEPPHNVNDHASTTGAEILTTIAGVMAQPGSNPIYVGEGPHLLALGPEHAQTLHRDGWTPATIRDHLWEHARIDRDRISPANRRQFDEWGRKPDPDGRYTVGTGPEHLHVLVAGGPGKHSAWIPSFGSTEAVSVRVPGG